MKFTIPAILAATIMIAGIFAFMPVQQASTVHTTITNNVDNIRITVTAFNDVAAIADVGDIAQDVADTFGAIDDGILVAQALAAHGRVTVTQAAFDNVNCNIDVTVTDFESGAVLVNDLTIIAGAALNDVGFFSVNLGDPMVDEITISVATDGAAPEDCDGVGLDFDTRFKVLRSQP